MSYLEDVGARLRATADQLPHDAIAVAVERLRLATDLLTWVRRESANPIGVPGLQNATEHLEQAGHALRVGQDTIGEYLAAIGLTYQSTALPDTSWRAALREDEPQVPRQADHGEVPTLGRWWEGRVNFLAEHSATDEPVKPDQADVAKPGGHGDKEAPRNSGELLWQTAKRVRDDDRERLRKELAKAEVPVGLGMSALTPPLLKHLATELIGHEPGPDDLPRLEAETRQRVRQLMPNMPEHVVTEQLARVCRMPPVRRRKDEQRDDPDRGNDRGRRAGESDRAADRRTGSSSSGSSSSGSGPPGQGRDPDGRPRLPDGRRRDPNAADRDTERREEPPDEPTHPTDSAVAGAILTGILLHRLDRDPDTLRQPDQMPDRPTTPPGGARSGVAHG